MDIISAAPVSDSDLCGGRLWSTRLWTFLGDDFWKESVFSSWFNTGYMFTSVFRGFLGYFTQVVPFTPAFSDEEVTALVVDKSGTAGLAGYDACRAVFPLIVGVLVVDYGGMFKAGFAGDDAFFATFPLVCRQARDVRHRGRCAPEGLLRDRARCRQWHVYGWFCWGFFTSR